MHILKWRSAQIKKKSTSILFNEVIEDLRCLSFFASMYFAYYPSIFRL